MILQWAPAIRPAADVYEDRTNMEFEFIHEGCYTGMMSDWQRLLKPEIQKFIKAHEKADVGALALKKPPASDVPYALVLDQIKSRQKAARKISDWLEADGIVFRPPM